MKSICRETLLSTGNFLLIRWSSCYGWAYLLVYWCGHYIQQHCDANSQLPMKTNSICVSINNISLYNTKHKIKPRENINTATHVWFRYWSRPLAYLYRSTTPYTQGSNYHTLITPLSSCPRIDNVHKHIERYRIDNKKVTAVRTYLSSLSGDLTPTFTALSNNCSMSNAHSHTSVQYSYIHKF